MFIVHSACCGRQSLKTKATSGIAREFAQTVLAPAEISQRLLAVQDGCFRHLRHGGWKAYESTNLEFILF